MGQVTRTKKTNFDLLKVAIESPENKKRFDQLLGVSKSRTFATSILSLVSQNQLLKECVPSTIINAAMTAATINLPISKDLGFAWVIPYKSKIKGKNGAKDTWVTNAQFQIGYKGFIQLALRTGAYKKMNAQPVYQNQFKSYDSMSEDLDADMSIEGEGLIVGYFAYFQMMNGFEKMVYWPAERVLKHGARYSKTYGNKFGIWKTHEVEMCLKTVLKHALSKWGMLSVDTMHIKHSKTLNAAMKSDQSVQNEFAEFEYVDNESVAAVTVEEVQHEKEKKRLVDKIKTASSDTMKTLQPYVERFGVEKEYQERIDQLTKEEFGE